MSIHDCNEFQCGSKICTASIDNTHEAPIENMTLWNVQVWVQKKFKVSIMFETEKILNILVKIFLKKIAILYFIKLSPDNNKNSHMIRLHMKSHKTSHVIFE